MNFLKMITTKSPKILSQNSKRKLKVSKRQEFVVLWFLITYLGQNLPFLALRADLLFTLCLWIPCTVTLTSKSNDADSAQFINETNRITMTKMRNIVLILLISISERLSCIENQWQNDDELTLGAYI